MRLKLTNDLHIPMDGYDTLIVMFQGSIGSLHLIN